MYPTLQQVCDKALSLPASPVLLPKLTAVLENPDSALEDIEAVLRLDPVLAASTIRLANSAFFAASDTRVESVGEAVMRLGLRETYRLAALALAGRWMTLELKGYRWEPGDFFRASLVTAMGAEVLAQATGAVDAQQAYIAGLVMEIGKLAVAYSCGDAFGAIRQQQQEAGGTWLAAERAVLGYDHATVGAVLLRQWRFPERCAAIAEHNPPGATLPVEHRALAAHVHAAKCLASALGSGQGEDGFLFVLNEELLSEFGLTPEVIERAMLPVLERAEKILRDKFTTGRITI